MFRKLRADEIDVRVQSFTEKGAILLLYKDARADMNILDETIGALNWKREHTRDNQNCIVSIWNDNIKQWVSKEDTGTESNTEKEKGLASDSFKRACFNWGIGRELYTSGLIFVGIDKMNMTTKNGKAFSYDKFEVKTIGYDEYGNINQLEIYNINKRIVCFTKGKIDNKKEQEQSLKEYNKKMDNAVKYMTEFVGNDIDKFEKVIAHMNKALKHDYTGFKQFSLEELEGYIEALKKKESKKDLEKMVEREGGKA